YGTGGLGPIMLISPFNTLNNCGNSSKLVFLKKLPTLVTLGSPSKVLNPDPIFTALSTIVLNLIILKILPSLPSLSCLKNTGPLDVNLIAIEINNKNGAVIYMATILTKKSKIRFILFCIAFIIPTTFNLLF